MRNTIIAFVVVGGLFAIIAANWNKSTPVEAARIASGPIREFVDEQGQTRLPHTHQLTMPFNARIEPIDLAEGSSVKAGQVVARLVPLDMELAVAEARAGVDRAKAAIEENDDIGVENTTLQQTLKMVESMDSTVKAADKRVTAGEAKLNYANKNFRRMDDLRQRNAVAEDMFNQAEMQQVSASVDFQQDVLVAAAMHSMQAATVLAPQVIRQYITRKSLTSKVKQQELAQAEARLKQMLRDQERGEMKSPIDGTILERRETNERQVAAGTLLVSIGNLDTLEVEADILSQDVVNVAVGQPVEIYGPAIGHHPAHGKVTRIYPAGFTKVSSLGVEQQRVKVIVGFEPSEVARLRQERGLGVGYRVRARIFTAAKENVPLVPRSAMFRSPTGDWQVFAVRDSVARLQTIEVGLMNDRVAEAVRGLAADDVVVLSPETSLVDGAVVRAVIAQPAENEQR